MTIPKSAIEAAARLIEPTGFPEMEGEAEWKTITRRMGMKKAQAALSAALPYLRPSGEAEAVEPGAPRKLWLGSGNEDGEHSVWFDADEGGTPYIRADLAHSPQDLPQLHAAFEEGADSMYDSLARGEHCSDVAALREALEPFAEKTQLISPMDDDCERPDWTPFIPVGAYRKAATALAALQSIPKASAEGVAVKAQYRLLERDEIIRADDEFLADDTVTWVRPVGWEVGARYVPNVMKAARRILSALRTSTATGEAK